MATVYLHIGLHKTGTTALQYFLWQNNEVLNQHGICFPDFGLRYPNANFRRNGHFLIAPGQGDPKEKLWPGRDFDSTLDKVSELSETYGRIILSDEAIWQRSGFQGDRFWPTVKESFDKRGLQVKIIVYLRRQDLWVQSFWKQKVKVGSSRSFENFTKRISNTDYYPLDFAAYLDRLSGIFGKESLIVRVYEKGQYAGPEHNLHSDFLDIFGLTLKDGFTIAKEVCNTSLDGSSIELRRILNGIPVPNEKDHILSDCFTEILKADRFTHPQSSYTLFADGAQRAFLESYAASNARVAREYLGREDGVLFYDELKELPEGSSDDRGLLRDTILLSGQAICMLEKENRRLRREVKRLRKDLEELREDVIWYRLKRKKQHLLGKDKAGKNGQN